MLTTIKTFNSHAINNGTSYSSRILSSAPATANITFIEMARSDPIYSGTFAGQVRNVPISIKIANMSNRAALEAQLRTWFKRGAEGDLVATFGDDATDYTLPCVVQSLAADDKYPGYYVVIFQSAESDWRAATASTASWSVTASGDTKDITVAGHDDTRLSIELTPTAQSASGYQHIRLYQLYNQYVAQTVGPRPWCITLDTAALVTAGKMQADCDDLRVVMDGVEVRRWIAAPNTTATKVWINTNVGRCFPLVLVRPIAATGAIGEMTFAPMANNYNCLMAMPDSGVIFHGTEWIKYSGKDATRYKVAVTARGILGTTMQAHAAMDTFYFIPQPIYLMYGNAAATNPATDDLSYDNAKPIFDLAASTNLSWVYTAATKFYDPVLPTRPGSWTPTITKTETGTGNYTEYYPVKLDADTGDAVMGARVGSWLKTARWQPETARILWSMFCTTGMSVITVTGSKYRSGAQWGATLDLNGSRDGYTYTSYFSESKPVAGATWTDWAQTSFVMNNPRFLRFKFDVAIAAEIGAYVANEIRTVTLEFTWQNMVSGTLMAESSNYLLDAKITNTTTGDIVYLLYPMRVNLPITLDGEAGTIVYDHINAHGALSLDDEGRDVWMRLTPGVNTLKLETDNATTMALALSWYARRV